jgi:hemerythrin-like domain-containing protein
MTPALVECRRERSRCLPICSYCGCESEEIIATLMGDHARIGELVYLIRQALDEERLGDARLLTNQLAAEFERHSREEEAGLFTQVRLSGEGTEELDRLVEDHGRLRSGLSQERLIERPDRLRALLEDLSRHAEVEDNDFFPFVLQALPSRYWEALAVTVQDC